MKALCTLCKNPLTLGMAMLFITLSALGTLGLVVGVIQNAHAEISTIHCTFGTCKVEVTPDHTLEVSCDDRAMYSGPYVINTEYRTIRIQGAAPGSPRITTQSLSASGQPNKATLFIVRNGVGRDIEGACKVDSTIATDTLAHGS